jgi:hypothetical protein
MRNVLAFIALACIGIAAIGWYRGWYSVKTTPTANGGRNINIDVNSPKISQDLQASKEKLRKLLSEKEQPKNNETTFPDGVPAIFHSPEGEIVLPSPDTIDISDYDGGWWPAPKKK